MNTRFLKWLRTVTVFFCMLFVAANVSAKKPVKPPPPPDPVDYGSLCADSGSFFPAFAYIFTGEIFLSNSAGDCSISIYTAELTTGGPYDISYRFFSGPEEGSGHGKIVWAYWDTDDTSILDIKLLEFQLEAGAITTTFPLTPRIVLQESDSVRVNGPDLSPDGNKIIVTASETGGVRAYIWEFDIPESGVVAIDDIRELARLDENEDPVEHATFHNIRYGLSDQRERVYFGYDYPVEKISYIEKGTDGLWSEPVLIVERPNAYPYGPDAVGLWDFGSGFKEVLTIPTALGGNGPIKILDVDACVEGVGDCVVLDSIEGYDATSFTTFTVGQLPALLYLYVADTRHVVFSIRECDLSAALASPDACYRTVIDGIKDPKRRFWDVDSAD